MGLLVAKCSLWRNQLWVIISVPINYSYVESVEERIKEIHGWGFFVVGEGVSGRSRLTPSTCLLLPTTDSKYVWEKASSFPAEKCVLENSCARFKGDGNVLLIHMWHQNTQHKKNAWVFHGKKTLDVLCHCKVKLVIFEWHSWNTAYWKNNFDLTGMYMPSLDNSFLHIN